MIFTRRCRIKKKNFMIKLFENYFVYSPLWWNYGSLYTLDYKGEYKILFEKKKKKKKKEKKNTA